MAENAENALIPGVDYEVATCPNCGKVEHTPEQLKECVESILGPRPEYSPCCDARYSSAYGLHPFSIVVTTRRGVKYFEAEWLPTRCRKRFLTKREATAWVKSHEKRCYTTASK